MFLSTNALDVPTSTSTYLQAAAPPTVETAVSQRPARKKQPFSKNDNGSTNTAATICFYHTKFGPDARRCQPGCKFAPLLSNNSPNVCSTKDEFFKMEKMGIIRRSKSPWSSALHVVQKSDGSWRPCGDYRHLNCMTEDDRYSLPHIQDFNNWLADCNVFSKIDLVRGYHQIPVAPASVPKTAIITPFGLWEFLRMPFGLKNAGQAFQRLMDGILRDIPFAFVYLDDILVATRSHDDHQEHLKRLFSLLSSNGLVLNKAKCLFGAEKLDFLGHQVSARGISPLPDRVTALREHPAPKDRASLQRFLGLINYYHRFIPHVSGLLAPLQAQASGKGQSITWSNDCQVAFESVKEALSHVTLLHHPRPDAQTSLTVNASSTALGAQLEQRKGTHPGPKSTQQAITQRFVWHGMKKDIRQWCQECHACQASKLHRHTHAPLQERTLPTTRFQSIHIDLVGPLPVSQNNRYLLTIIDIKA